jgi:hypothetical protein
MLAATDWPYRDALPRLVIVNISRGQKTGLGSWLLIYIYLVKVRVQYIPVVPAF